MIKYNGPVARRGPLVQRQADPCLLVYPQCRSYRGESIFTQRLSAA